ncbi:MAG: hypothetical protein WCJ30_17520 [Deltaproteobacteria bacterium]
MSPAHIARSCLLAACVGACRMRGAPMPDVSPATAQSPVSAPSDARRMACYPDGNVAIADLASCTVARLTADAEVWRAQIAGCSLFLEVTVARDSMLFVRTSGTTVALGPDGHEVWRRPTPTVSATIAAPATTPGSLLVMATSPTVVTAFPNDGGESWHLTLPVGETMVTAPVGNLGEGIVVMSQSATYFVGGDGAIRGRRPHLAVAQ